MICLLPAAGIPPCLFMLEILYTLLIWHRTKHMYQRNKFKETNITYFALYLVYFHFCLYTNNVIEQLLLFKYKINIDPSTMKNYPHLYNNILSKKAQMKASKTPKKSTTFTGPTFTTKASTKTLGIYNSTLNRDKKQNGRALTRSIQEHHRSVNQNEQFTYIYPPLSTEDEELFSQSYSKIGKIKQDFPYKNIDLELNEVLNLIKEQKLKINEKMKNLKKSNDYYKKICEGYLNKRNDYGMNTEQIINCYNEKAVVDVAIGSQQSLQIKIVDEPSQSPEKQETSQADIANKEAYIKLSTMLQQMNINPRQILPTQDKINEQILINDYKALTDKETIKIQKFFIKKLIQKISK